MSIKRGLVGFILQSESENVSESKNGKPAPAHSKGSVELELQSVNITSTVIHSVAQVNVTNLQQYSEGLSYRNILLFS
jgi:hypothetical protein